MGGGGGGGEGGLAPTNNGRPNGLGVEQFTTRIQQVFQAVHFAQFIYKQAGGKWGSWCKAMVTDSSSPFTTKQTLIFCPVNMYMNVHIHEYIYAYTRIYVQNF